MLISKLCLIGGVIKDVTASNGIPPKIEGNVGGVPDSATNSSGGVVTYPVVSGGAPIPIDLSHYYTKTEVNSIFATKEELIKAIQALVSNGGGNLLPTYDPNKVYNKWYVLVLGGQSNSVGYDESANDYDYYKVLYNNRIKQLNCRDYTDDTLYDLGARRQKTMQNLDKFGVGKLGTKGMHLPLANLIAPHLPNDYGLLIIPCSYGDTGFTRTSWNSLSGYNIVGSNLNGKWGANEQSAPYLMLKHKIKVAMNLNSDNKFLGMVWLQGEADNNNADGHKSGFEAMMTDLFTFLETNFSGKSVLGKFDKDCVYIPETIYHWYSQGACRTIWDNYKAWNNAGYVAIDTNSFDSNETNGVSPVNTRNGSVSSTPATHYGNNAFARKVAPAIFNKMIDNGLIVASKVAYPYVSASDNSIPKVKVARDVAMSDVNHYLFGTDNTLSLSATKGFVTSKNMTLTNADTKWSVAYPVLVFKSATKITFKTSRGLYFLGISLNDDYTKMGFITITTSTLKNTGTFTRTDSAASFAVAGTAPSVLSFARGDVLTIESLDDSVVIYNETKKTTKTYTRTLSGGMKAGLGFAFNISDKECLTTWSEDEKKLLLDEVKVWE